MTKAPLFRGALLYVRLFMNMDFISHGVGRWLAAAVKLSLINDNSRLKAIYKSAKVGSDSEPSRGRLQPNRRAERDFCEKGGVA